MYESNAALRSSLSKEGEAIHLLRSRSVVVLLQENRGKSGRGFDELTKVCTIEVIEDISLHHSLIALRLRAQSSSEREGEDLTVASTNKSTTTLSFHYGETRKM